MNMQVKTNKRFETKDASGQPNGFLVPLYNVHEGFHAPGKEPQQVYMTVVFKGQIKGPHLHFVRTGCFTCIKGNARFVLKTATGYEVVYSGEAHEYRSVIVATGTPAALHALGDEDAYVLNMPTPAWTPDMHDEHSADFRDFDFSR